MILGIVRRKTLVLDLDETLIHSFHDGVLRPTVRPGTPPDFILKVTIDRHPVRFFVHKRPHVDFFLQIVSISYIFSLIFYICSSTYWRLHISMHLYFWWYSNTLDSAIFWIQGIQTLSIQGYWYSVYVTNNVKNKY